MEEAGAQPTVVEYRKRRIIYNQGSRADTLFFLLRGSVKLTVVSPEGKEAVITILSPGCFFGEACLAGQDLRQSTAAALTDSSVAIFKKNDVWHAIREKSDFADFFISYLILRNSQTEEDLADKLFNSSEKRLARILVLLAHTGKDSRSQEIVPKVDQATLAKMIGTTRGRVSFFMTKFRRLGFIEYNDGLRVHSSILKVLR